jgi:phosphoribosylglycinamide formyltransferase-1
MPESTPDRLPVAVLLSGGGTTLVNLLREVESARLPIDIRRVIATRECAGVAKAEAAGLATDIVRPRDYESLAKFSDAVFDRLRDAGVELVVLAGFLSRIDIPADFAGRVMNIHPALIPAFCGEGMYGHHVHEAVIRRGCKVSGCTVHFCDNEYDHGPIILQRTVPVLDNDTPDTLAARVFAAECEAYPEALRLFAERRLTIHDGRVLIQQ